MHFVANLKKWLQRFKRAEKVKIQNRFVKYHRTRKKKIVGIIIHYISAINIKPRDPYNLNEIIKIFNTYKVSADYLISRKGVIYKLVPNGHFSFHAGVSKLKTGEHSLTRSGKPTVNEIAIGIELMATSKSGYTDAQYTALTELTKKLMKKYSIQKDHINGHQDVCIPRNRKKDPGKKFEWKRYLDIL